MLLVNSFIQFFVVKNKKIGVEKIWNQLLLYQLKKTKIKF